MSQAKVTKRAKFLDNFMMREPQHDSEGHIFDPNELEIPRVIVDVEVAEPPSRRIGHMVRNRRRNINTLPTSQLSAEIKIRIFIVQEEILVQETDLVEHPTPIEHCGTAGAKDGLRRLKLPRLSVPTHD